jgi:hypothetical protein
LKSGDREILVAISLAHASPTERLQAAGVAFRYAARVGIDTIKVQPAFIRDPPDGLAEGIKSWIGTGKRHRRWVVFERPSADDTAHALAASCYIEAVNLFDGGRVLVSISDTGDNLDLELNSAEWEVLGPEIESILGGVLRYDVAELTGSDST